MHYLYYLIDSFDTIGFCVPVFLTPIWKRSVFSFDPTETAFMKKVREQKAAEAERSWKRYQEAQVVPPDDGDEEGDDEDWEDAMRALCCVLLPTIINCWGELSNKGKGADTDGVRN